MDNWKFLIQREGDREWRTVKTARLQLPEGKYRIVAIAGLTNARVQIRVSHQSPEAESRLRKAPTRSQNTNEEGSILVMPLTQLLPGIWQFICSGEPPANTDEIPWHQILKLKVLPQAVALNSDIPKISTADLPAPASPIPMNEWLDPSWEGNVTDRPPVGTEPKTKLEIRQLQDAPDRTISLDRDAFSGIPGARLCVSGACNLQALNPKILRPIQLSKLSICLRYSPTGSPFMAIEQPIPPEAAIFSFSGQFDLPKSILQGRGFANDTDVIVGEVSLYDRHNIQLAVSNFHIDLIAPIEPSFIDELPEFISLGYENSEQILDRIGQQVSETIDEDRANNITDDAVNLPQVSPAELIAIDPVPQYPTVAPIQSSIPQPQPPQDHRSVEDAMDYSGWLNEPLTNDTPTPADRLRSSHNRELLEIVVDD
jgi:hypothetical protein